jgi:hypothetical protein
MRQEARVESMATVEQFRARGRLCIERATRIPDCGYKELYFYNASQWIALADELEARASDHLYRVSTQLSA